METILLDAMYEVPGSSVRHVLINEKVVQSQVPALYWSRGQGTAFWQEWNKEEEQA
jgi:ATP-dependent Clp protease ATP-binding subunit ClpX